MELVRDLNTEIWVDRALSVWQPWAWAIAAGHKRIENRTWRPQTGLGQWIAIHAGQGMDKDALDVVREITGDDPELVHGAIVGVARLADVIPQGARARRLSDRDLIWFSGPYGWLLEDAIALKTPVPCRGYQSLWRIDEQIREQLHHQLRAA